MKIVDATVCRAPKVTDNVRVVDVDGFDVSPGEGHPRSAGTFSRILGRYVREQKLLTLEDAVRQQTELAADGLVLGAALAGFGIQEATGRLLTYGYGYAPLFYGAASAYLLALGWVHLLVPRILAEDEKAA